MSKTSGSQLFKMQCQEIIICFWNMIHICKNGEAKNYSHDKGLKIRSFFSPDKQSFQQFGIFEECISGHSSLKNSLWEENPSGLGTSSGLHVEFQVTAIISICITIRVLRMTLLTVIDHMVWGTVRYYTINYMWTFILLFNEKFKFSN